MIDETLLNILACPEDKGPLYYFEAAEFFYNPRLQRRYEIREGIPVMLLDEATSVSDAEHKNLMEQAAAGGIRLTFEEQAHKETQ